MARETNPVNEWDHCFDLAEEAADLCGGRQRLTARKGGDEKVRFQMNVELDNDAFAESLASELARILQVAVHGVHDGRESGLCIDANGNSVGQWVVDD